MKNLWQEYERRKRQLPPMPPADRDAAIQQILKELKI